MHWFWRGTIAVVVGVVPALWAWRATFPFASPLPAAVFVVIMAALPSCAVYGYICARYGPGAIDRLETRCRKCQYILRGITEPRCPECGERI